MAPEISIGGNFTIDENGDFYSTTKIYGYVKFDGVNEDYKFWLGLLNSNLFWFFIKSTGYILRGGYYTFKTNYIEPFPVPKNIPSNLSQKVIELVDKIVLAKNSGDADSVNRIDKEIDLAIYNLYDISDGEVKFIEDKTLKNSN